MFIPLISANSLLYGKNRRLDYDDGTVYEGEIGYEELPKEGGFSLINWIMYKVFGVMEPHGIGRLTFTDGIFMKASLDMEK